MAQNFGVQTPLGEIDLNMEPMDLDLIMAPPEQLGEMDANEDAVGSGADENVGKKDLSNEVRRTIFQAMLTKSTNRKLKHHVTREVVALFLVKIRPVQRIWKRGKDHLDQGTMVDVSSRKCNSGCKRVRVDVSALRDIPFSNRTTLQDLYAHLHVGKGKLLVMKQESLIRRHSNSIKPYLTEQNKKDRLRWCISMLDPRSMPNDPMFKGLFDVVFIDEKWFHLTRKTKRYYMLADEDEPIRTCKSKNFIPKIMFLCALARPRFDSDGNCTFDGKIWCFHLVTYEPAKRTSARAIGTIEMKPITFVTKEATRTFLIDKILPAIQSKWPRQDVNNPIFIQQDNARPHIMPTGPLFCEAAKQDGFDIQLICQPANSPDFNILDLGFFHAIQSIQYKKIAKTIDELVPIVEEAFHKYPVHKSNRIFLTLSLVMMETIEVGGGNGFKIPHMKKEMLERQGRLPLQISCNPTLVGDVMAELVE